MVVSVCGFNRKGSTFFFLRWFKLAHFCNRTTRL